MFEKSFCSSPWFHLRLTYNGDFKECRWFKEQPTTPANFASTSLLEFYNSDRMKQLRKDHLNGDTPTGCTSCYYEDEFDKLSGRARQLLKSGIQSSNFALTTRSSPHYQSFLYSMQNNGNADYAPVDLQIDLGNTCNSACIMCDPMSSSRLHQDYQILHKLNPTQFVAPLSYKSWTRDPELLERFIVELINIPNLTYIHFLGGETLYDEAFYTICNRLVSAGLARNIIIGTTTNGTVYDTRLETLIKQFKEFHLGISIESVTELNDYIRYPGKINNILENTGKFLQLRNNSKLYISLRITPNIFTISEIDQLFEYMIKNNVIAESCNILFDPACLRIELLPDDIRQQTIKKLDRLIAQHNINKTVHANIRNDNIIPDTIANVILDYRNFVATYQVPADVEIHRHALITFLKSFESIRNNNILEYAPEYEEFLRTYGY